MKRAGCKNQDLAHFIDALRACLDMAPMGGERAQTTEERFYCTHELPASRGVVNGMYTRASTKAH